MTTARQNKGSDASLKDGHVKSAASEAVRHKWVSRRVNNTKAPFAVINSYGPVGDTFVAAFIETEEVARLIAAAPDLLQAARAAEALALKAQLDGIDFDETAEFISLVRAAIAKAGG